MILKTGRLKPYRTVRPNLNLIWLSMSEISTIVKMPARPLNRGAKDHLGAMAMTHSRQIFSPRPLACLRPRPGYLCVAITSPAIAADKAGGGFLIRVLTRKGRIATGDFSAPYAVPLGNDTRLIVFDSSFVGTRRLKQDNPVYRIYAAQMQEADGLAATGSLNFYINHHPILGLAPKPTASGMQYHPGNAALQSVLETIRPSLLFPPQVQALLAGHVHVFQMASFDHDHPTQFISGNGGSWVEDPNLTTLPPDSEAAPHLPIRHFTTTNQYGFMTMQRDQNQWRYEARNRMGEILARCDLVDRLGQCTPDQLNNAVK